MIGFIPWPYPFLRVFVQNLAQALLLPITTAPLTLLYYDLRIRKEAFDLQMLSSAMEQPTTYMIGYCGILLALLAATPSDEVRVQALPAVASAADKAGDTYREQVAAPSTKYWPAASLPICMPTPTRFWRIFLDWFGSIFQRVGGVLKGLPEWLFWAVFVWMVLALVAILAHLIYTLVMLLRGTSSPLRSNLKGGRISGELLGIRDLDFDTVHAEARRLLAAGDWTGGHPLFLRRGDPLARPAGLDRLQEVEDEPRLYRRVGSAEPDSRFLSPTDGRFRADRLRRPGGREFHDSRHRHHGGRSTA